MCGVCVYGVGCVICVCVEYVFMGGGCGVSVCVYGECRGLCDVCSVFMGWCVRCSMCLLVYVCVQCVSGGGVCLWGCMYGVTYFI